MPFFVVFSFTWILSLGTVWLGTLIGGIIVLGIIVVVLGNVVFGGVVVVRGFVVEEVELLVVVDLLGNIKLSILGDLK